MTTTNTAVADLLRDPLAPDWTVAALAERVLDAVAALPDGTPEVVIVGDETADRQTRRLLRPLLAHLATRFAAEAGAAPDLYGGRFVFERPGPVWVVGRFENRPGSVRVALRRSGLLDNAETTPPRPPAPARSSFVPEPAR